MLRLRFMLLLAALLAPVAAHAEKVTLKTQSGKLTIDPKQQLMLDAANKVIHQDYQAALGIYNQVLASDPSHIQAYIQRSVVKRELKDARGSQQDAAMAVRLAEAGLQQNAENARLYYQRGTGYRLLKDFPKAIENIRYAMQLKGGKREWETDLRAIALEQKMNP